MATLGTPPGRLDLRVVAGEPVDITMDIFGADGEKVTSAGSPSWSVDADIRSDYNSTTTLFSFTADITAGTVRLQATGAQTAAWQEDWPVLRNPWDLVVTDLDDVPHYLCGGWVYVYPTVSR